MDLVNSELDRDHRPPHKVGGRRLSLRLALVGFFVIVAAYVGVFSGVIAFQILPVVQDMKGYSHRTMAIASTRPPLDHAIEGAIDRAHANLFLGFPDTPSGRSEVVALLRSFGDSGWVIDAMRALGGEPEIQEDLARALGAENAAIATLLAVAVSIELDDVDAATRQLFQADSLRHVAVAHLEAIEGPALMSTFSTERAVSATAEVAGQLVRWWIVAGIVILMLFAVFFHRRFYRPIAQLDIALRRVAAGDLDVRIPDTSSDELGRLAAHFNEVTASVRQRSSDEQDAIRRSAQEWRLTFDAIADPVILVDHDGVIIRLNEAARVLTRVSYGDAVGRRLREVGDSSFWRNAAELSSETLHTGRPASFQLQTNGGGKTWSVQAVPVHSIDDSDGAILVCHDVTNIAELQESLRRSETMAAMGSLLAGVAHEVRNPLFGMSATLDAFEARHGTDAHFAPHVDVLREQLARMTELMRELLEYGKPPSLEVVNLDIAVLVNDARRACHALEHERNIEVDIEAITQLPTVRGDALRLTQVFTNVISNAVHHAPVGTSIDVRLLTLIQDGRSTVEVAVRDHGPGIAPEDVHQIFDPFFTRRRGGTGMGLALVQRILEQHGGSMTVRNHRDGGAVARIRLPVGGAVA